MCTLWSFDFKQGTPFVIQYLCLHFIVNYLWHVIFGFGISFYSSHFAEKVLGYISYIDIQHIRGLWVHIAQPYSSIFMKPGLNNVGPSESHICSWPQQSWQWWTEERSTSGERMSLSTRNTFFILRLSLDRNLKGGTLGTFSDWSLLPSANLSKEVV